MTCLLIVLGLVCGTVILTVAGLLWILASESKISRRLDGLTLWEYLFGKKKL